MKRITIVALLALTPSLAAPEPLAITFDDLPLSGPPPADMNEVDIVKRVLPIFAARRMPPMYGFINARKLETGPSGGEALKLWVSAGQLLGSHTYSHVDLTRRSAADFTREIQQNEPALLLHATNHDWRWFRYPYLHEGDTQDKRREVREFLRARNYRIAQVTLDFEDYQWNVAYARCSQKNDASAVEWLRASYLDVAGEYVDGQRAMARTIFGREINHVLLLHLGAFSPHILPSLFDLLERRGFQLVTLEQAQRDPAYQVDPNFIGPKSGTLIEQHMNAKRLPFPPLTPIPEQKLRTICS